MFVPGSTDTVSYSTQGVNDPITAALHVIIGELCCWFQLLWIYQLCFMLIGRLKIRLYESWVLFTLRYFT